MVGSWMYSEDDVEPFEFEIDPSALMGAPEPFELPAITTPTLYFQHVCLRRIGLP